MKHYLSICCALLAGVASAAQGETPNSMQSRVETELRTVQAIRSDWSATIAATSGSQAGRPVPKVTCAIPTALPAGPSPQAQIAQFAGAWSSDDRFNATVWREACPSDVGASILYFRVTQVQGVSFICGGELQVGQNGTVYDPRLVLDVTHTAYCDDLHATTTFVIDQYSDNPQFDNNGAFTLTFKNATSTLYTVSLPAYGGGNGSIAPAAGLWWNPAESGSGYALDVKHGVLVVTAYSYTSAGAPLWYLAAGAIQNNTFSATLDKYQSGQCISCGYRPAAINGNDGVMTITFSTPTTGTMSLPGGRVFPIVPQPF